MKRSAAEFARWVRQVHEVPVDGPVDLERLVAACGGMIQDVVITGCSGVLLPLDGIFGIVVRESDSRRRKRFTVAHELGHFCIPSHKKSAVRCVSPETTRDEMTRGSEREANDFAAELLLPRRAVAPMIAHGAIDLERAAQLAETFDVSTVSAALRMCEVTRERAAVLYYRDSKLRWAIRFGMPFGLPDSGTAPPDDTVASDVASGRSGSSAGLEVQLAQWLPLGDPERWDGELLESSSLLDSPGEILTVLWLTESA